MYLLFIYLLLILSGSLRQNQLCSLLHFPDNTSKLSHITIFLLIIFSYFVFSRSIWTSRLLRKIHVAEVSLWEVDTVLESYDPLLARLIYGEVFCQSLGRRPVVLESKSSIQFSQQPQQLPPSQRPHSYIPPPSPSLVNSRGMTMAIVKVSFYLRMFSSSFRISFVT